MDCQALERLILRPQEAHLERVACIERSAVFEHFLKTLDLLTLLFYLFGQCLAESDLLTQETFFFDGDSLVQHFLLLERPLEL